MGMLPIAIDHIIVSLIKDNFSMRNALPNPLHVVSFASKNGDDFALKGNSSIGIFLVIISSRG